MKPKATDKKVSTSSLIRKSLFIYLPSAILVPAICFIFGWRSLENIGTGFLYASLGLALFGALMLAGNMVPAQLSRLSLPKYSAPSLTAESDISTSNRDVGIRFLTMALICGAFLFVTGLILKMM